MAMGYEQSYVSVTEEEASSIAISTVINVVFHNGCYNKDFMSFFFVFISFHLQEKYKY